MSKTKEATNQAPAKKPQKFYLPTLNKVVKATSLEEAINKAKENK